MKIRHWVVIILFDIKPKTVNTKGNKRQEPPLNPISKKLHGRTVKIETVPVNDRMLYLPII